MRHSFIITLPGLDPTMGKVSSQTDITHNWFQNNLDCTYENILMTSALY